MDLRGQRFTVDLSDDEDETGSQPTRPTFTAPSPASGFLGEIRERPAPSSFSPPSLSKSSPTGFPEHRKRTKISAFKQQRGGASATEVATDSPGAFPAPNTPSRPPNNVSPRTTHDPSGDNAERQQIHEENQRRLDAMSTAEIEEERQELLAGLDPSLIERLLKRANLDEGRGDTGIDPPDPPMIEDATARSNEMEMDGGIPAPQPTGKRIAASKSVTFADEAAPSTELQQTSEPAALGIDRPKIHFPSAPSPTHDLDPSDPSFLENLHRKYFPNLPTDPTKLAWMAPIPTHGSLADQDSPYYPAREALPASALRFDFRGGILPPRIARAMPSTKGLHHHGDAPEAAGYTVPELARLARSAFPAQRCMAFQTLGRLLYRLGRGEWGPEESEVTKGLWRCVEEGKVVQTLEEAAVAEGGHQGSKIYAVEAVWLWQKGGGKVWKAS